MALVSTFMENTAPLESVDEIELKLHVFSQPEHASDVIELVSFGYKYGPPPKFPSNIGSTGLKARIFDTRKKVRNPFRVLNLRKLNGLDPDVQAYVNKCKQAQNIANLICYRARYAGGRRFAIGCHGGKHRSVAIVEHIAATLRSDGRIVTVTHRDIGKH